MDQTNVVDMIRRLHGGIHPDLRQATEALGEKMQEAIDEAIGEGVPYGLVMSLLDVAKFRLLCRVELSDE